MSTHRMSLSVVPPRLLPVRNWTFHHPVDYVLVILLVVCSGIITVVGKPHCRTFEWTDPTINFPPHADSFPGYSLALMGVFAAVLFIVCNLFLVRLLRGAIPPYGRCLPTVCPWQRTSFALDFPFEEPSFTKNREWNVTSGPLISWLMALVYAVAMEFFCVSVLKLYVGRLRPDFLSRLAAHGYTSTTEKDPLTEKLLPDPHKDPQFFCDLGYKIKSAPSLVDGRLSFPSGHSSTSFAVCTVVVLFLFSHLRPFAYRGSFLRLCLAFSPFWVSLLCATSRTRDNKHHYSDILAGSLIGLVSGLLAVCLCFRVSGGPSMVMLERADDDAEYTKAEKLAAVYSSANSPNQRFFSLNGTTYMGTTSVNDQGNLLTGNSLSSPAGGEERQRLVNDDSSFIPHCGAGRNTQGVNDPESLVLPTEIPGNFPSLPCGCLVVTEQELNESNHAVPWI